MSSAALAREQDPMGALLDGVARFCRAEIRARDIDARGAIPRRVLEGLGELGVFGVTLPERFGGAGLPLGDACRLVTELARADRSVATTVGLHLGLGTRALVRYGGEALRARYLPELASGRTLGAFATTEPNAGSDLSALATTATSRGERLTVTGQKLFVTNGGLAGVYTATVSTPGLGGAQRGTSLVLFERGDEGVVVGREESKLGLKGSSTTPLTLDGVHVGHDRIIGEPGRGAEALHHVLSWGRTLMSAGCCGTARAALDRAREHTASRRQFGKTLSAQPVVREQLATMAARLYAMQALVEETAALEQDEAALLARSVTAKVLCSEGASFVVDTALQLLGGMGFIEESGMPLLWRDVRITRIFEGANDVLLTQLGARAATAPAPRAPLASGDRDDGLRRRADAVAARVAEARERLSDQHRIGLLRQPRLLHRLGRALMWSEALDAAVRAHGEGGLGQSAPAHLFAELASAEVASALAEPPTEGAVELALDGEVSP